MAQISKQVLGQNRGAIADVVFRKKGDGTFTSSKPGSYTVNDTPEKVLIKQKFRLSVKVASAINGLPDLKGLWPHNAAKRLSGFNQMVKMNFGLIAGPDMSGSVALTYDLGFRLSKTEIFVSDTNVAFTADPIGPDAGIDPGSEKFTIAEGVLVLASPTDPRAADQIHVIKLHSGKQTLDLESEINFNILLDPREAQLINMYSVKKAFIALITTKQAGDVVHYSNSYFQV